MFVVFYKELEQQLNTRGGNGGRKALCSPFEVMKLQKGPLGQSASTYFVTVSLNRNLGTVALSAQVKSNNFFSVTIFTRSFYEGRQDNHLIVCFPGKTAFANQ